jgi:HEXXH motif-containing protein
LSLFSFGPVPARAQRLDERVRDSLAGSLNEIADAIGEGIGFPPSQAEPLIRHLRAGPVAPGLFAIYTALVEAALREDAAEAATLAKNLRHACEKTVQSLHVVNLTDDDLGPGQAERYRRIITGDEPEIIIPLAPVDEAERLRAGRLITVTLSLLDTAAPEIAGELRALVREVVIVHSAAQADDSAALELDGASSFYLWGALLLNSARQRGRVSMAVTLVHEAVHGLLFGMSLGAPLVENAPEERYPSPLRDDLRPMDGLFHATYVLARMIDCLQRLLRSSELTPNEISAAQMALAQHQAEYDAGLATVTASARFTQIGAVAFHAMRQATVF